MCCKLDVIYSFAYKTKKIFIDAGISSIHHIIMLEYKLYKKHMKNCSIDMFLKNGAEFDCNYLQLSQS